MVSALIFIEGGGDGQLHERSFRKAWSEFFRSAGLSGRMPAIVRGGGRQQTYEKFAHAVRKPRARKLPVLLVDSEDRVGEGTTVWQHLQNRDCSSRPQGAQDDQAFLMVVAMETWFLADRELLKEHFGPELAVNHFKKCPHSRMFPKRLFSTRFRPRLPDVRIRTRKGRYRSISWLSSPPISSSLNARTPRSFWSGYDACSDS